DSVWNRATGCHPLFGVDLLHFCCARQTSRRARRKWEAYRQGRAGVRRNSKPPEEVTQGRTIPDGKEADKNLVGDDRYGLGLERRVDKSKENSISLEQG